MARKVRRTRIDRARMVALIVQGLSDTQIAQKLGCSRQYVYAIRTGREPDAVADTVARQRAEAQARRLILDGATLPEICRATGLSEYLVRRLARRAKLTITKGSPGRPTEAQITPKIIDMVQRMHNAGATKAHIARSVGISPYMVGIALAEAAKNSGESHNG